MTTGYDDAIVYDAVLDYDGTGTPTPPVTAPVTIVVQGAADLFHHGKQRRARTLDPARFQEKPPEVKKKRKPKPPAQPTPIEPLDIPLFTSAPPIPSPRILTSDYQPVFLPTDAIARVVQQQAADKAAAQLAREQAAKAKLEAIRADDEAIIHAFLESLAKDETDRQVEQAKLDAPPEPKPGKDGADGKEGAPGRDGRDGYDGKDGAPGLRGADGRDGVDGEDGRDGKDGVDGKDGKDGEPGQPGPPGPPGNTGYVTITNNNNEAFGGGGITDPAAFGAAAANLAAGTGISITKDAGVTTIALATTFAAALAGGSTSEVGVSVPTASLTWSFTKTITAQELAGTGTVPPALTDRAQAATGPYTTDTTFTITGHTGTENASATTTVAFQYKRYWGVSASASLNTAGVLALSGAELATARQQTRVMTPSAQYMYFAFPSTFGTPTFKSNGFNDTAWSKTTIAGFVNASGATVSLDVWRSDNLVTGTFTEEVL